MQIFERALNQLISLLMETKKVVVGIDLGTTTSCAFVPYNGKLENIVHQQNRNTIDSVIRITPKSTCILNVTTAGHARQMEGKGCVYEAKRLMGKKYAEVKKEVKKNQWPFEVFEGDDGYAAIRVTLSDNSKRELYPEEVGAYILRDIRKRAERLLDCSINSCVIGCPVDFSFDQRKRTVEAAVLAGFNKDSISLYSESTLAAIAYAEEYDREETGKGVYLVYDFGGGTFDVSIVTRNGNEYKAEATEGDGNCGGKDIDARLMSVIREDLEDDGYEINENRISKMKFACKQMKEFLLIRPSNEMCCDFVKLANEDEEDYPEKRMTSAAVDAIAKPVIEDTIEIVKKLLKKSSYTVDDIDYVFMTGGSSKLNGVRASLESLFGAEKVKCDTACLCEAAIAKGAALMGLNEELHVEVVPTPHIDPYVPKSHFTQPMPYSVMIKTTDGEVELAPEGTPMDHEFFKYVFPSSTSNSAVIEFVARYADSDSLSFIGRMSIPVDSQKDVKLQPLRGEARMKRDVMNVCVKNEVDNIDYTVKINLYGDEEDRMQAIRKSIAMGVNQKNQKEMQELRTAIQAIYDSERYGDKLNEKAKKDWKAVVKKSESCSSVEELKKLKEKIEKMKSELCTAAKS